MTFETATTRPADECRGAHLDHARVGAGHAQEGGGRSAGLDRLAQIGTQAPGVDAALVASSRRRAGPSRRIDVETAHVGRQPHGAREPATGGGAECDVAAAADGGREHGVRKGADVKRGVVECRAAEVARERGRERKGAESQDCSCREQEGSQQGQRAPEARTSGLSALAASRLYRLAQARN